MQGLYYLLFTKPNPLFNIFDYYVSTPLGDAANRRWKSSDFQLRDKLGGGNFGITFEALRLTVSEGPPCMHAAAAPGLGRVCGGLGGRGQHGCKVGAVLRAMVRQYVVGCLHAPVTAP